MSEPQSPAPQTALGSGLIPLAPERKRYTLPSGRIADIRQGKGKDLRLAARMTGDTDEPIVYEFALIAVKTLIDGQAITVEQVEEELSDDDVAFLLQVRQGKVLSDTEKEAKAKAKSDADAAPSQPST